LATKRRKNTRKITAAFIPAPFCAFSCLFVANPSAKLLTAKPGFQRALLE
jgi:hypothetical protein